MTGLAFLKAFIVSIECGSKLKNMLTISVWDFDPRGKFSFLFSNIAEICFCPFVLLAVGFLLRQTAFPVKMVSLCENEKTFSGEFLRKPVGFTSS